MMGIPVKSVILETKKQTAKPKRKCPYSSLLAITKTVATYLKKCNGRIYKSDLF